MANKSLLLVALLTLVALRVVFCRINVPLLERLFEDDDDDDTAVEEFEDATSASTTHMTGWLKIKVIGTGKACYVKQYTRGISKTEQFGDTACTDAFIKLFGEPECEIGDGGFAFGKVRAYVAAAAYEKGEECLATVISSVITDPFHRFSVGDVGVRISGEAVGEALALCEDGTAEQPAMAP